MVDQNKDAIPDFQSPEVVDEALFRMYEENKNRDASLASHYDRELNEIISAPSTVYLLDSKIGDPLYGEDTNPVYGSPYTNVIGFYQPNPVDFELNKWGLDAAGIDMLIMFNKEEIDSKLPREIEPGDLIVDTYNRIFECMYAKNDNNFQFDYITEYVLCKLRLGDLPHLIGRSSKQSIEDRGVNHTPDPLYGE